MPELAEVETTRRDLSKYIIGEKILNINIYLDKLVFNKKDYFISETINQKVYDVKRRGKYLLLELKEKFIVIHFKMEGRFYLKNNNIKDKHDYAIFEFCNFSLHFNDPRLFGNMQIVYKNNIDNFFAVKKLGLEYYDNKLDSKYLKKCFENKKVIIKKALLDQKYITGIGNIYADEILFRSKINPKTLAKNISLDKLNEIINNTRIIFEESLLCKGTYPNIDGKRGTYEKELKVHTRKGKECYDCGSLIVKEQIGGRGTYYCPNCQK